MLFLFSLFYVLLYGDKWGRTLIVIFFASCMGATYGYLLCHHFAGGRLIAVPTTYIDLYLHKVQDRPECYAFNPELLEL